MGKSASTVLREAKALLLCADWVGGDESRFASEAVDEENKPVRADSKAARRYTIFGACVAISKPGDKMVDAVSWLKLEIKDQFGYNTLYDYNILVAKTKEDVIKLFNCAIARAERTELRYG